MAFKATCFENVGSALGCYCRYQKKMMMIQKERLSSIKQGAQNVENKTGFLS